MSPTIRQARTQDAEAISTLIMSLLSYFIAEPESAEVRPFLETLSPAATKERINSDNYDCFVAEHDARILGVIALRDGSHVYHLFVRSDAHGRGIARALWEHVRSMSAERVFTVNSSLYAAPVYERLGFRATAAPRKADGLEFVPMEYRIESQQNRSA